MKQFDVTTNAPQLAEAVVDAKQSGTGYVKVTLNPLGQPILQRLDPSEVTVCKLQ